MNLTSLYLKNYCISKFRGIKQQMCTTVGLPKTHLSKHTHTDSGLVDHVEYFSNYFVKSRSLKGPEKIEMECKCIHAYMWIVGGKALLFRLN